MFTNSVPRCKIHSRNTFGFVGGLLVFVMDISLIGNPSRGGNGGAGSKMGGGLLAGSVLRRAGVFL